MAAVAGSFLPDEQVPARTPGWYCVLTPDFVMASALDVQQDRVYRCGAEPDRPDLVDLYREGKPGMVSFGDAGAVPGRNNVKGKLAAFALLGETLFVEWVVNGKPDKVKGNVGAYCFSLSNPDYSAAEIMKGQEGNGGAEAASALQTLTAGELSGIAAFKKKEQWATSEARPDEDGPQEGPEK